MDENEIKYEIYISKESQLFTEENGGINIEDWESVIENNNMNKLNESVVTNPDTGELIKIKGNNRIVMNTGNGDLTLELFEGRIKTIISYESQIRELSNLGKQLNAICFGEEGERY